MASWVKQNAGVQRDLCNAPTRPRKRNNRIYPDRILFIMHTIEITGYSMYRTYKVTNIIGIELSLATRSVEPNGSLGV